MNNPLEIIKELRTHPERYHPVTNKQFDTFDGIMKQRYDLSDIHSTKQMVDIAKKIVNDEQIDKVLGWNVGIIYEKPWFQLSWKNKDGETLLVTITSKFQLGQADFKYLDDMFEMNGVYRKDPNFKFSKFEENNKKWTYDLVDIDEEDNGSFFGVIIKIKQDNDSPVLCQAKLYPIRTLIEFNEKHKKRYLGTRKDNEIKIHKEISKTAYKDLIEIRSKKHLLHPITKRQWLDFNDEKIYKVLECDADSDGKMPFDYRTINVGGYTGAQLREGYKKAKEANDEEAAKLIEKMLGLYNSKLNAIHPVITVKKIIGWNTGLIKEKPWFSTCWEDANGRLMMDILFSTKDIENASLESIESICSSNDIYHTLSNFLYIPAYIDRANFTFNIQLCDEGDNGEFYRITLLLRKSIDSPKVCDAEFYAIDCLNEFNKLTHIVEQNVENRITQKNRLDNEILKTIDPEDIVLLYYNMASLSKQFVVVTLDKKQDDNDLKKVGKNIFVKQNNYIWYSGTYGTQNLLPDDLIAKFGLILDDDNIRQQCGNANATFALDGLFGECNIGGWLTINDTEEHLIISPNFRNQFLDELDNRLILPDKTMRSNIGSDFGECWKKIIQSHFKQDEELQFKHQSSFPKIDPSNVIAFSFSTCEAQGRPGLVQLVMENKGSLSTFAIECAGNRNKKNLEHLKTVFPFLCSEKIKYLRDRQSSKLLERCHDKLYTSFDLYRGGYNYYIPDTDWRWYDTGFGTHVFIQNKYKNEIFTRKKIEQAIKDLKLIQMHNRNIQEFCHLLVAEWKFFFDDYRKQFLDRSLADNEPQDLKYTIAISINDEPVKKVIKKSLETGEYDANIAKEVANRGSEYAVYLTNWLELHNIIGPAKGSKTRPLLFKTYEDIKKKVKMDEDIEDVLTNGYVFDLGGQKADHLSTSASIRIDNGEITFESVDYGNNVEAFFGGAKSVDYTIRIDQSNTKQLLESLGINFKEEVKKKFGGVDARHELLNYCDENGIKYKEDIWTDYD